MGMTAKGLIKEIFETKQVSERFSKREFVVEIADNPKYPQFVLFQATGDRCAMLDSIGMGDAVTVDFSLRGREWKSPSGEVKYFNTLDVWRVDVVTKAPPQHRPAPIVAGGGSDAQDDIPFASCSPEHDPSPVARVLR